MPKSLQERRGERAIITVWFGLIPFFFGAYGIFNFLTNHDNTRIIKGDILVSYKKNCSRINLRDHCLQLISEKNQDTFQTKLSKSEQDKYLSIVRFSDSVFNRTMDSLAYKNESLIEFVKRKERNRRLGLVQNHIKEVELELINEGAVKMIKINGQTIRKYPSSFVIFLFCLSLLVIGTLWISLHVKFFIKDPYNVYQTLKDPFSKWKN